MSRPAYTARLVRHALLSAILLVGLGGCRSSIPLTPLDPAAFNRDILSELDVRSRLTQTIRTQMSIQIEANGERSEVRAILYYKRPDSFRLDILDPLSAPVVIIRTSDGTFSMLHIREGKGVEGPLTDALMKEQFGLDIRISDVVKAIAANPFESGDREHLEAVRRGNRVIVKRPSERVGYVEEIVIDEMDGEPIVTDWRVREGGKTLAQEIRFWNYRDVGGILRPMDVLVARPGDETRLRFHATDPKINLDIDDASFAHRFPPGADIRRIDE